MSARITRTLLLGLALLALAVRGLAFGGWWEWRSLERTADKEPGTAATRAASDLLAALPSAAAFLHRLPGPVFAGATTAAAERAWTRIGKLQRTWLPGDSEGYLDLARAAVLGQNGDAATAMVAEAVRRDPTSPYLLRVAATLEMDAGRYEQALEHLADAEAVAPGYRHPPVEVVPGDEDWVRLEGLRRRAALYPRDRAGVLLALAQELRRRGLRAEAASALDPVRDDPEVRIQRARWALDDGRVGEAEAIAIPVAERNGLPAMVRARAWSVVALARAAAGDDRGADEAAETAMALGPDSPAPYLALARLASDRGEPRRALELLRRAWGVAPTDLGVLLAVAHAADAADQPHDARLALERAVEVASDRADVAAVLVQYLLAHREYMEAALRLSRALDRFPTDQRLLAQAARLERETTRPR